MTQSVQAAFSGYYTIPAHCAFLDTLACEILKAVADSAEMLPLWNILLPTRRACRMLRESFLSLSEGRPLLLPRMGTIGDVDEDALILSDFSAAIGVHAMRDIPPAISPLHRRLLLARTIQAIPGYAHGLQQALALADALGRLMDQIYTEGLDLSNLCRIVPEELAAHWQITTRFLQILTHTWPEILAETGQIDSADRRDRLLRRLADHWESYPPQTPVIAAGSTGSIPATARLLHVIAALPSGAVILPALDQHMDAESWACLDETHPQATLKSFLSKAGVTQQDVKIFGEKTSDSPRLTLAREITRPAQTTGQWQTLASTPLPSESFAGLFRQECETTEQEALVVALAVREALESPDIRRGDLPPHPPRIAVITPDRVLARRIAMHCRRWGLIVDDSGGRKLADTRTGSFLRLCLALAADHVAPVSLLALLKHPCSAGGLSRAAFCDGTQQLERALLRGIRPRPGWDGLKARLAEKSDPAVRDRVRDPEKIERFLARLESILGPLCTLAQSSRAPFAQWLDTLLHAAEALAQEQHNQEDEAHTHAGGSRLWSGEDGESASLFFSDLRTYADLAGDIDAAACLAILETLMAGVIVRPAYGSHPRVSILGQIEARLAQPDVAILAGLNEGTWPADPAQDPWMSRPMRADFGLPPAERSIGLSAHDFVQGLCAPRVLMTRARRTEGSPTVPARWLQRFDAVLKACGDSGVTAAHAMQGSYASWALHMDHVPDPRPVRRPEPRPPVSARPSSLSVTRIETWRCDPYAIYARHILGLVRRDPPDAPFEAALRGIILHDVLERFLTAWPERLPPDPAGVFTELARVCLDAHLPDPALWAFWWPRLENLAVWLAGHESAWRERAGNLAIEARGKMAIDIDGDAFTLTATADRIDRLKDGTGAVIDYKSGGLFSQGKIKSGALSQLPLEALILESGGFAGVPALRAAYLGYWTLGGTEALRRVTALEEDVERAAQHALAGLTALVRAFRDESTPYYSVPRMDRPPRFNDYERLARVREWATPDQAPDSGSGGN